MRVYVFLVRDQSLASHVALVTLDLHSGFILLLLVFSFLLQSVFLKLLLSRLLSFIGSSLKLKLSFLSLFFLFFRSGARLFLLHSNLILFCLPVFLKFFVSFLNFLRDSTLVIFCKIFDQLFPAFYTGDHIIHFTSQHIL